MAQNLSSDRLHGLDALRAVAMLLGIILHAAIAYKVAAVPTWPHDTFDNSYFWDYLYSFIHSFRMPLFFLVAGYFCRLLYVKNGANLFIKHRIKRIGIPFLASLLFLLPLTIFPFLLNKYLAFGENWDMSISMSIKALMGWNGMAHFWFLYFLIIYYILFVLVARLLKSSTLKKAGDRCYYFLQNQFWVPYYLIAGTILCAFLVLMTSQEVLLGVSTGIVPNPTIIGFYGVFFLLGCLVNIRTDYFNFLEKNTFLFLATGSLLSFVGFYFEVFVNTTNRQTISLLRIVFCVQCMLLVNGFIGVFLRFFKNDNSFWRYLSDASYWMYLIHLGIIAFLQILLQHKNISSALKFLVILTLTSFVSLVTYHYFVRYSIIGRYLHGERKLPKKKKIHTPKND